MSEQSSNTVGPELDEQLKHEAQPIVQGHGSGHVEEFRQTVAMPDDTDDPEVEQAAGIDGELKGPGDSGAAREIA